MTTEGNRTWPARPTTYRDRLFRSRLEAKWASFFDELGWSWEYEPEAIGGWMPDFLLRGPVRSIYVEVKPEFLLSGAYTKVAQSLGRRALTHPGLVVGEAPLTDADGVWIGWALTYSEYAEEGADPPLHWGRANLVAERRQHALPFDLLVFDLFDGCLLADGNETSKGVCACSKDDVFAIWNRAANRVMWKPPGAGQR